MKYKVKETNMMFFYKPYSVMTHYRNENDTMIINRELILKPLGMCRIMTDIVLFKLPWTFWNKKSP